MKEACLSKVNLTSLDKDYNSYKAQTKINRKERKNSFSSSSPENSFNNLNTEIKSIIENETDLSFTSNSNSENDENKSNIEHLYDSKYWRASKDTNSETDEPISTYDSQNEKDTPSKKDNFIFIDKKNSPKPFHSKYADVSELIGMSEGSNKQSTQSNEDEETRLEHLHNISYCESNNISPINSLINNECDENEKKSDKVKINVEEEKNSDNNNKEKNNINITNNKKIVINGFNNFNNIQNLKYTNENNNSEFVFPYEQINYKNNSIPFFPI